MKYPLTSTMMTDNSIQKNYKLTIQYDGTHFLGWQTQAKGRTVQGEIEKAFSEIFPEQKITLVGSGRTDSGVHAIAQVANILLNSKMSSKTLVRALNAKIGKDVWIEDCCEVPIDFNSRYSAVRRSYNYKIKRQYSPFYRNTYLHIKFNVDPDKLANCSSMIIGDHDFTSFCKSTAEVNHKRCIVEESRWEFKSDEMTYIITANRFLQHMVRYLVGTMIEVARGRMNMNDFNHFLNGGHHKLSVVRAPANGLFLVKVYYQD